MKNDYPTIFKKSESIELKPVVLAYLVTQLQMYSLLESDIDVKGRAYEEIVGSNLRGDRGEFYTPRNMCRMAVEMVDPTEKQLILDPACGTGGFLITAMNHVIEKIRAAELAKWGNNLNRAEEAVKARIRNSRRIHRRHRLQPRAGQGVEDEHGDEQRWGRGPVSGQLARSSADL